MKGNEVELLASWQNTDHLGRVSCLAEIHDTEFSARIQKGWRKFNANQRAPCDRKMSLVKRLRFFNATISATILYGCCSWTMTCERENGLRSVQRKMLRTMIGEKRVKDSEGDEDMEPLVVWLCRCNQKV